LARNQKQLSESGSLTEVKAIPGCDLVGVVGAPLWLCMGTIADEFRVD